MLLVLVGPVGGGNLWLYSFSVIIGLTIGEKASLISLGINTATQVFLYILITQGMIHQQNTYIIGANVWIIRAVNFILLNSIIIVANIIYMRGLKL